MSSPRNPLYRQIAGDLRALIYRDLAPDEQIPSRNQLVEQYGCTANTIERAIDVLIGEGLVEARQGSGVFVRRLQPLVVRYANERYRPDPALGTRFFKAEAERQGYVGDQKVLNVMRIMPSAEIAARLLADEDEQVVFRRHLLLANDVPVSIADAHYRLELAAGTVLESMARIERGAAEFLTDELHIELGYSRYEQRMREPTEDERALLNLRDGEWIIDMLVTLHDVEGTPLRVTAWCMSGDRNAFVFDVPAG